MWRSWSYSYLLRLPAGDLDHDVDEISGSHGEHATRGPPPAVDRSERGRTWRNCAMSQTLSEKVWERHVVHRGDGEPDLLYVDLHLVHEVTSPQAFDGLRLAGRTVRRPDLTIATMDHNVPTTDIDQPVQDRISRQQMDVLARDVRRVRHPAALDGRTGQGIVHVIGPEQGLTQPGMTIVCGD